MTAALRVIDAEPPEAFTMRRVADELGVGVMTLYGYVSSKEEILGGVMTLVLVDGESARPDDAGWDERLRDDVTHMYSVCHRHPHLVSLVLAQTSASPGLFRVRERMLGTLLEAGFEKTVALHALGVLTSYAVGFGSMQGRAASIDLPARMRELPVDEFPHLATVAGGYAVHLSKDAFEFGLELLLDGLRAQAG